MDRTIPVNTFPEVSIFEVEDAFKKEVSLINQENGVFTYLFSAKTEGLASPNPITLCWRLPALNVAGVWKCGQIHHKRLQYDWELDHLQSRISVDAPVVTVFGHDDRNTITFACSDAVNLVEMNALFREEDDHLYGHLTFFQERHPEIKAYEVQIRVDTRPIGYHQALQEVSSWWASLSHLKPAHVPEVAKVPLYSTWYNFHQDLDREVLLGECKRAAELGFDLVIMDDGWQTMDTNRGYDYTGDWQPERFPDLAEMVAQVHQLGMKFGLWFSVPFCGKKSKAYQQFKGKFLTENHRWAPVFDPRYPEVRAHLIGIYVQALKTYHLDVFKLDFIDDFRVYPETVLTKDHGRDYANVNEAVYRLLNDVVLALRVVNSEVGIEFRQKYVGPAMRKFGNMFRAFDCPNDPISNRIRTTDVKLLCGAAAVHSDMLTWHKDENVEVAALQLLNGIFAVPQMSVLLGEYPQEHVQMIGFYTQYWKAHRHILLDGAFKPAKPLANYPLISAVKDGHIIIGVFEAVVVNIGHEQTIDLLNAKRSETIVVKNEEQRMVCKLTIWNCLGEEVQSQYLLLSQGVQEFTVPSAGMIRIERSI